MIESYADQPAPLSDPIVRFGDSNPFVLAVLGLVHRAEKIDACLPVASAAAIDDRDDAESSHDLDLALLGLVSLGHRLGQLAPRQDLAPRIPEVEQDLLR